MRVERAWQSRAVHLTAARKQRKEIAHAYPPLSFFSTYSI